MDADRDPKSIMFEADYWLALIADLRELHDHVRAVAAPLASVPLAALAFLLASDPRPSVDQITTAIGDSLGAVAAMQVTLDRMIELAGGRVLALRREGGLPE